MYMHYNMDLTTNYVLWIHQVIALRLVGLACEVTLAEKSKRKILADSILAMAREREMVNRISNLKLPSKSDVTLEKPANGDLTTELEEPSAAEIISYAYYFIGLHKGTSYIVTMIHDFKKRHFD